ncbi:serine hydrolase domain-containing protein [Maribacter sp. 2304DJ31-5]|uniref:serine hydrolase domain-containing protein n=1 Tax=Maribacter sp. 2304DJ31-5 TaxID=3386273 RepID=UPI0039BD1F51
MANPILTYLKNLFVSQRIIGDDVVLGGLVEADMLLQALVDKQKVPGLAIAVLKEGRPIFQRGYGYADLENKTRIHPQKTIFRIASISKPIAATALAHMVEEGIINLDASFYDYVPYYPKKQWDFTIRQLAGHTAGIRGYRGMEYGLNKPYSIKESIEIFKDDDLLFEPGTDYLYNSYGWVLISLAMQEVSGIPFEKYVREKVLVPLGMTATFAPENPKGSSNLLGIRPNLMAERSLCYSKNRFGFREAVPVNNYYKLAGGGYLSTVGDIAKLGRAYLEGKILNGEIISRFLTSKTINGKPTYYGLGWQVSKDKSGRSYYGHIGNGVGGYSNFFVYPEEQMVFTVLVNCTDPKVQKELDDVLRIFIEYRSRTAAKNRCKRKSD